MNSLIVNFNTFLEKETNKPYIPVLRILLTLVSIKEVLSIRHKFSLYFDAPVLFYREDTFTDFLYGILSQHHDVISIIAISVGLLAAAGLFTRFSMGLYAVLYLLMVSFDTSTGIYNHETGLSAQLLIILVFAPGVQNLSLDELIKRKFNIKSSLTISPYKIWGFKLILIIIAMGYFTAGVSKIRYGGFEWMDGNTLGYYLSGKASFQNEIAQKFIPADNSYDWKESFGLTAYTYGNFQTDPNLKSLAQTFSETGFLMSFLAIFTVIFELFAFFIIFSKPMRTIIFLIAVGFHFSIRILMGLGFLDYQLICLSLIDWPYLFNKLSLIFTSRVHSK